MPKEKNYSEIEAQIKKLPTKPGVYIFRDCYDRIIYIGKAINLKTRVRSYWNQASWDDRPKLKFLVPKIKNVETIITKTEKEALILESNLVFKHQPKYNVLLKDNKSFPWLVITYDEPFPRLIPVRDGDVYKKKHKRSKNKFFGPYTNVGAMWENLTLVHELFPLRRKRTPPFKNRPCLNYDLGKCLGPCQKLVSAEEYDSMLGQVEMVLNGDFRDLKEILSVEMQRHSDDEEFEKAAKARDQIKALDTFNEKQNVISQDSKLDQDTFVLVIDSERDIACGQVFKTRAGKVINRDTLEIDLGEIDLGEIDSDSEGDKNRDENEIFESLFVQYYTKLPESEIPKEILVSHDLGESAKVLEEVLGERTSTKVSINHPKRGEKYSQVELAKRNAKVILEKIKLEQMEEASRNINVALQNLHAELDMRTEPARIECYDISHIQGSDTVASLVCFVEGLPEKNQYRKFKISVDQNDDFASMREVISRRFRDYKKNELGEIVSDNANYDDLPNLIIIDGGKGQLSSAHQILKEVGLEHIKVVGLAKKEEEIFLPDDSKPIVLDRKSPELFLVQRIRNEAHRFAVSFHRQLRSKRALKSSLDSVPGLGPAKKKALLDHFGTLSKVKKANPEEIAGLKGFSESLAKKILSLI